MKTNKLKKLLPHGIGMRLLALLVLIAGASSMAFSQQITGTIVGTVNDARGAVVTTATVKATNVDTG